MSSGGGGGGSSISKDNCPSGDSSPSYYDGNCGSVVKVGTTNVATTSSSTVTPSGLLGTFFSAKAFEGIDFSPNKALPQKVYAEINFFAKKIMDIIAKKNISKEKTNLYYTALSSYFSKKAQLSDNTKSKRIYTALANRFLFLQKQFNGR